MPAESALIPPPSSQADAVTPLEIQLGSRSLEGLHSTVAIPPASASFFKQWRAFVGPAFLISVGYMDPGNWGTDLQAGASFKYGLLWVVALSSAMAIIMQILAAKLGLVCGKDLAQAGRDFLPAWTRWPNWLFCELAIAACDLAEVLGSAVALNLLFGIPLFWAVIITAIDVLLLLALQGLGMRFIEALVLMLVATIGGCYFAEIFILPQVHPDFGEMGKAIVTPGLGQEGMLVLAIGIIGATVMPHNLYLHSALVQSRRITTEPAVIRRALRFNTLDIVVALMLAFLVNAAILVLAAMVFHGQTEVVGSDGSTVSIDNDTDWFRAAYLTLSPLMGVAVASTLFAIALLASGQSSTITGTLAGQVVMEGFMRWKIQPWMRRLATRLLAIIPAILIIGTHNDVRVIDLLVLSQVALALQLPFAMFPLLYFTSSRKRMGSFRNGEFLLVTGWTSAVLITALDIYGLPDAMEKAWSVITGQ
jgi:manganese transport protein